jgi:hypothetical protein
MHLTRAQNAEALNAIVNEPSVYQWVHGSVEGPMDMTPIVSNPNNYALIGQHGAVIFAIHSPGIYEAFSQVLPSGRGHWEAEMIREALHWQFTHTNAAEIWTRVPDGNESAEILAGRRGFDLQFRSERGWVVDGHIVPANIYSLTIQKWMIAAPDLPAIGEWFHTKLREEYRRIGRDEPSLSEDEIHNRYVGAAVEMIRSRQAHKGAIFYNRFAAMVGAQPISILHDDPVMISVGNAILELHGQNFFVASVASAEAH